MIKSVDVYFQFMEGVILGRSYVPLEYENQFGRNYNRGGCGHICPFCNIGFWAKQKGKIKCPDCGESFRR